MPDGCAACSCGWKSAAFIARAEGPGTPDWKLAVRAGVARHRRRRALLTGEVEVADPEPPVLAPRASSSVIPFLSVAAAGAEGPTRPERSASAGPHLAAAPAGEPERTSRPPLAEAGPRPPAASPAIPVASFPHLAPMAEAAVRTVAVAPVPGASAVAVRRATVADPVPPVLIPAAPRSAGPERAAVEFAAPPPVAASQPARSHGAAALHLRLGATLVDAVCAALAALGFDLGLHVVSQAAGLVIPLRFAGTGMALAGIAAFTMLQLLCLLARVGTPGMRSLGLVLRGLEGQPAPAAAWRRRGYAVLLSIGALGLGYLWAYLDDSHLAWHDRLSGTVLTPRGVEAVPGPAKGRGSEGRPLSRAARPQARDLESLQDAWAGAGAARLGLDRQDVRSLAAKPPVRLPPV